MGEALIGFQLEPAGLGIVGPVGASEQQRELGSPVPRHMDEAPGMELAVIGRAHRRGEDLFELGGRRPGRAGRIGGSRAARGSTNGR